MPLRPLRVAGTVMAVVRVELKAKALLPELVRGFSLNILMERDEGPLAQLPGVGRFPEEVVEEPVLAPHATNRRELPTPSTLRSVLLI